MGFLRGRLGSQIGRFLRGKLISYFCQKLAFLTLLKTNFLIFFFGVGGGGGGGGVVATVLLVQLSSGTAIVSKEITCGRLTHIGNGIKEHKNS